MTNKITNYEMWANLEGRYGLEARGESAPKSLSDIVIATADADAALARDEIQTNTDNLSGAAGTFIAYFAVPDGEEWLVWMCNRAVTVAASSIMIAGRLRDGTFGTLEVSDRELGAGFHRYDQLRLFQGGGLIGMRTTGNGGDGAITLVIFYRRFLLTR